MCSRHVFNVNWVNFGSGEIILGTVWAQFVASNRIAQDNAILEVAPCKNREEGQNANSVLGSIVYSVAGNRR